MAMIGLGAVMLKLKMAKEKGGIFQFIPPKEDLRPSDDAGSATLGIERTTGPKQFATSNVEHLKARNHKLRFSLFLLISPSP